MNIRKVFTAICNLKYYISWNIFSIIGWIDVIFFRFLYLENKNDTSGLGFVFYGGIYIAIIRIISLFLLLLFLIEKIKKIEIQQHFLFNNIIYNVIFYFGLVPFFTINLFILFLMLSFILNVLQE